MSVLCRLEPLRREERRPGLETRPGDGSDDPLRIECLSVGSQYPENGRSCHMVRERDAQLPTSWPTPPENPYLEPLDAGQWYEYVGDQIYADLTPDLSDPDDPVMNIVSRYTHAGGLDGTLLSVHDAAGERFFHGDMLGTTRLQTDGIGAKVGRIRQTRQGTLSLRLRAAQARVNAPRPS